MNSNKTREPNTRMMPSEL